MSDLNDFARRYIDAWNEAEAGARRTKIVELFAPDAVHYTPTREFHGHEQLEARFLEAYEQFVKPGEHVFRAVENANGHHDAVRFNWEMLHLASGEVRGVGFDFIVLDKEGRIKSDHQFIDG
ncbi:nuclear transport factor 2 family protein [Streptomyces sp. NPDC006516]|uniref:nuclear transport factor 2 family protein n=1 Tax=Streptomyces sp. NPDC006516 TaxID=3154309 RepID=UPI0033A0F7EF